MYDQKLQTNAMVTVVGTDQVGIIAAVAAFFSDRGINIEDINQTILSGNFVMVMMVNLQNSDKNVEELKCELVELGKKMDVTISMMHEQVFSAMHRI
ncbi:UPF0237 protein [Spirochaetia bacterium]|nr:UPF0237 protein [Spirochaetia bacterium]